MMPSPQKPPQSNSRRHLKRGFWVNPTNPARHLAVFLVAATGFFTDSYNLFATNVILPSLAFVYWPGSDADIFRKNETAINTVTLAGSALGQLLFGYLADRFGRRKLYGIELILVIISTLGLTQASNGYGTPASSTSMDILGWLIFYRLLQGIGIGAEYPLSATICAEYAPVSSRARMMAGVFTMQPLGQIIAAVVGLCVAIGYNNWAHIDTTPLPSDTDEMERQKIIVDSIWRWVIGVGAIPTLIAILFRFTIPESPRYTLEVEEDADRALIDAQAFYTSQSDVSEAEAGQLAPRDERDSDSLAIRSNHSFRLDDPVSASQSAAPSIREGKSELNRGPDPSKTGFWKGLRRYLFTRGHWRRLAGVSLSWAILDFVYYGLGINSPRTLAKIWAEQPQSTGVDSSWNSGLVNGTASLSEDSNTIYLVLRNDALRSLITSSIGSLIGSLILVKIIPYVARRAMLYWTFLALFVLLLVTGSTLFSVFETNLHALTIALFVLTQLVFNLGPNTLLFIIPAEIFPTRYRATCYGISSAAGKVSSVVVQAFLPHVAFGAHYNDNAFNNQKGLAIIIIVFSVLMLPGAFVAWLWVPELQNSRTAGDGFELPSKTLEELAEDDGRSR